MLYLSTNLSQEDQTALFINTGLDIHSICQILLVDNLTDVFPQNNTLL